MAGTEVAVKDWKEKGMSTRQENEQWKYAERAMAWHGWGSPVGLGIFLVAAGALALLLRAAILGF